MSTPARTAPPLPVSTFNRANSQEHYLDTNRLSTLDQLDLTPEEKKVLIQFYDSKKPKIFANTSFLDPETTGHLAMRVNSNRVYVEGELKNSASPLERGNLSIVTLAKGYVTSYTATPILSDREFYETISICSQASHESTKLEETLLSCNKMHIVIPRYKKEPHTLTFDCHVQRQSNLQGESIYSIINGYPVRSTKANLKKYNFKPHTSTFFRGVFSMSQSSSDQFIGTITILKKELYNAAAPYLVNICETQLEHEIEGEKDSFCCNAANGVTVKLSFSPEKEDRDQDAATD